MNLMARIAITGACALVIGGIMALIAFGVLGFDVKALDSCEYSFDTVTAETLGSDNGGEPAVLTEIEADLSNVRINIVGGDSFGLDYFTTDNLEAEHSFDEKTGRFEVKAFNKSKIFGFGIFNGIKQNDYAYTFTVPSGLKIKLKNKNCTVVIRGVSAEEFVFDGSNSDVRMTETVCGTFSCSASNSQLGAELCEIGKLSFDGSNSAVRINKCKAGTTEVVSSNGMLKAEASEFGSVKFSGSNATLKFRACAGDVFGLDGNNATFDVSLKGQKSDFGIISMTGRNATFRLCGEKFGGLYEGTGTKKFTAHGNNMTAKLHFE